MKQVIKYASIIFALMLAAAIIGGCLTAGVAVVKMIVEKTEGKFPEDWNNKLWYETEDGDIVFLGIRFDGDGGVQSGSEVFDSADISSIKMQDISGELLVEVWDSNQIYVEYDDISDDYEIKNANGVLVIEKEEDFALFHFNLNEKPRFYVKVPADMVFGYVDIDKGSGSAKILGIAADVFHVDSGSGSVSVSDAEVSEFDLKSGSGSVSLSGITADRMIISSGSGAVTVKKSVFGETSMDTGSGFATLDDVTTKNLVVDSGSGRVKYSGYLTGNCVFESGSGSVSLEIYGKEEDYNIHADMGSGGLYVNGSKKKDTEIEHDGAKNTLIFDAGSGRVSVEFKENYGR